MANCVRHDRDLGLLLFARTDKTASNEKDKMTSRTLSIVTMEQNTVGRRGPFSREVPAR